MPLLELIGNEKERKRSVSRTEIARAVPVGLELCRESGRPVARGVIFLGHLTQRCWSGLA